MRARWCVKVVLICEQRDACGRAEGRCDRERVEWRVAFVYPAAAVVGVVALVPTRSSKEDVGWPGDGVGGEFF